ncbi:MAG: hypothetical protein HY954_10655 [Deltaproteobacteria bacterium]|nr:hypothetical protein [Deltaproteobacteria bacterium]
MPPTKAAPLSWGKDPFTPAVRQATGTAQAPEIKLKAIFYNDRRPSAIINDNIVYSGSVIMGQKVIDIGRTHVILQGENGSIRLDLAEIPELHNGTK